MRPEPGERRLSVMNHFTFVLTSMSLGGGRVVEQVLGSGGKRGGGWLRCCWGVLSLGP